MNQARIAIIGGGLSGLYAAYLLESQGISDYVLFEARDRLGGRALSVALESTSAGLPDASDRFDLGPSWFWPDFQPQLDELVTHLQLSRFIQPALGDALVERAVGAPPVRTLGYPVSPPSVRLLGGIGVLVDALASRLDPVNLRMGQGIRSLRACQRHVEVDSESSDGNRASWTVEHVLLAAPPRLVAQDIEFCPTLAPSVLHTWRSTPTWMAPHAKYLAVYESPFWNQAGLSGQARSAVGPLVEIHDASSPGGHAALFGFVGVPAHSRRGLSTRQLRDLCRAQLVRLYGSQASEPVAEFLKDWAQDSLTAVAQDLHDLSQHPTGLESGIESSPWAARLIGIGSEWSPQFPGYIAGAIEAAALGVRRVLSQPR